MDETVFGLHSEEGVERTFQREVMRLGIRIQYSLGGNSKVKPQGGRSMSSI